MNSKLEAAALNAVRNLINLSNCMTSDEIKEGDKGVSFDGYIPIYLDNNIKKNSFYNKIDIQVKGRTVKDFSNAKNVKFSMSKEDVENYKKIGGVLIFLVHVNADRKETKMYVKSLLPYEINGLLHLNKDKKRIPLQFEFIDNNEINKFEHICFQFQKDKDKQYSYKDDYKTIEDFEKDKGEFKLGINDYSTILTNPIDYLSQSSFIYFHPEKLDDVQIPCGIVTFSSIGLKKCMDIEIAEEVIKVSIDFKQYSDYLIININDCIIFNTKTNLINFKFKNNLTKVIENIEIIKKFIDNKSLRINGSQIFISDNAKFSTLEKNAEFVRKLKVIVDKLKIKKDPIVNFEDAKSINNFNLIYGNIIERVGIPFRNDNDIFIFKLDLFDLKLSFVAEKNDKGLYDLINLNDLLWKDDDVFSLVKKNGERIIVYPNFSVFNKNFRLDASYLLCDNVIDSLNNLKVNASKVSKQPELEANLTWFVLDGLEFYDMNNSKTLLDFLESVSKCLVDLTDSSYHNIYFINYCQVLKRLNKLSSDYYGKIISLRENSSDYMIKVCTSILLDDINSYNYYYSKLSDEQLKLLNTYPILGLLD